jgi:hypothetical protein
MGPIEQKIARQAMRERQPLPDRIAKAPTLLLGSQFYLDAFFDLDAERSHAMAPVAIPRSCIVEYAKEYELDEEEKDDLIYLVRCMDNDRLKGMRKDGKNAA